MLKMDIPEMVAFLADVFPQLGDDVHIDSLVEGDIRVRLMVRDAHLRPGGTVSGPSMFMLADCAFYMAVLAHVGPEALCVTTNCSIDFMRRPSANDMIADVRLHKLGRSLAVGDVLLYSEGVDKPVARASLTYSIPPQARSL
ncbi:thioesterase [Amylibacter marinus]|uniref:Thioesterase n=1 Tax=Amylibacter marinus TaxID=1475483 RepID=A0ABQ5VSJ7_9RHOB|nr:PaaI family thioesterase [Amylibacter marinus]GLQ34403.1 thioesterase [Amylibacter marinus]